MRAFIFWTGILSVLSGAGFQFPTVSTYLMPGVPQGMLLHVFGLMAIFLGLMLVFCARDLKHRGVLVAWEGVLRLAGGAVMAGFGIFAGSGSVAAVGGLSDFAIGVIYLVWLPQHLGMSLAELLFDRSLPTSNSDDHIT